MSVGSAGSGCGGGHCADDPAAPGGWVRRHVLEPARAAETLALYASLGFETRTEPLQVRELAEQCRACLVGVEIPLVVYTRRRLPCGENRGPGHGDGG
jgi:hypothetical protein